MEALLPHTQRHNGTLEAEEEACYSLANQFPRQFSGSHLQVFYQAWSAESDCFLHVPRKPTPRSRQKRQDPLRPLALLSSEVSDLLICLVVSFTLLAASTALFKDQLRSSRSSRSSVKERWCLCACCQSVWGFSSGTLYPLG